MALISDNQHKPPSSSYDFDDEVSWSDSNTSNFSDDDANDDTIVRGSATSPDIDATHMTPPKRIVSKKKNVEHFESLSPRDTSHDKSRDVSRSLQEVCFNYVD